ncbi:Putative lipopolysaccharide biosynthesis protein [Alteracholeplasma palmae J233]|uniref:Putative lipopolysaccharide biosynthesis protein n=2 Tax=Acholeplasma palmae TaxID=38986 RepID=U4KQJ6_ALTPJ|nr:Putative lipopolysaccharide biosynthesis protein [Alteracholeplasma palmae J233]
MSNYISKANDVSILLLENKDSIYLNKISNKVKVYVSPVKGIRNFRQAKYINKFIKDNQFKIVHVNLFPAMYFSVFKKSKTAKYIFTEHNTHNKRRKWYFKFIENIIYSKYDAIVAISEGVKNDLKKWLNKKNFKKVNLINNGIDIEKFDSAIAYQKNEIIPNFEKDDKILLMVGRFTAQKDQDTIIKALTILPKKFKLVLVGDGERVKTCHDLASELKLDNRVKFLGIRNDIERITKTADLCIVSSNWEGFGLVAVEAMAAEKPVIASDVEGLNGVVSNYGVLFEPKNYVILADEITKILTDKNLYVEYTIKSKERAKFYSIEKMCNQYLELYERELFKK